MQIGQLASQSGVAIDTVRYYERSGLIEPPQRRPSGYRDYRSTDVERIRFIRQCKALGFTLDEIRELLRLNEARDGDRAEVRALAENRLEDIERRLAELQSIRDTLKELVASCSGHGPIKGCPIIERVLNSSIDPNRETP